MDNHIAVTKKTNGNFNSHIFAAKIIKNKKWYKFRSLNHIEKFAAV